MLETIILYYRVAFYIPSSSRVQITTLFHFYHHLHRLHYSRTTIFTLISRIKPCVYRVTCFSGGHQSCHYFKHYDNLFSIRLFLKRITDVVKNLFISSKLRIILLSERVMYVLRRPTPNIINLIVLVTIRY